MDALIANVPKDTRLVGSSSSSSSSMFVVPSESEPYDSVDLIYVRSPKDGRRIDENGNQRRTIQRTTVRMVRYYTMSHKGWKPETMMYAISHDFPAKYEYLGTKNGNDPNGDQSWFFFPITSQRTAVPM